MCVCYNLSGSEEAVTILLAEWLLLREEGGGESEEKGKSVCEEKRGLDCEYIKCSTNATFAKASLC